MNLLESLKLWRYWIYRAFVTYSIGFRESKLGLIWPTLSVFVVVLVIGTIWSILLNKDDPIDYYIYLLCGYPVWSAISGGVNEGCRNTQIRTAGGIPALTVVLEKSFLTFLPFATALPAILLVLFFVHKVSIVGLALFPLVLLISLLWVIGVIMFLMALVSLLPDLQHLIKSFMRLAFLATPIIWEIERLGIYQKYVWLNPFYVPLESVRSTLYGFTQDPALLLGIFFTEAVILLLIGGILLNKRLEAISD